MKLNPLGPRVLVRPLPPERQSRGGITFPEISQRRQQQAIVLAVGDGRRDEMACSICRRALDLSEAKVRPFPFKVGDTVLVSRYTGTELKIDDDDCLIVSEDEILGVIEP